MPRGRENGRDFTITVEHLNETPFIEHKVTHDPIGKSRMEFGIESHPSKPFRIFILDNNPSKSKDDKHVMAQVVFDITKVQDDFRAFYKKGGKAWIDDVITPRAGGGKRKAVLRFPAISKRDAKRKETAEKVGQIEIRSWYGTMDCLCNHEAASPPPATTAGKRKRKGATKKCTHPAQIDYDPDGTPFYTFVIKYGSKNALYKAAPVDIGAAENPIIILPDTPQSLPPTSPIAGPFRKRPREVSSVHSETAASPEEIKACEIELRLFQQLDKTNREDLQVATGLLKSARERNEPDKIRLQQLGVIVKNAEEAVNSTVQSIRDATMRLESLRRSLKRAQVHNGSSDQSDDEELESGSHQNLGRLTRAGREKALRL